jgi:hypothetical protein
MRGVIAYIRMPKKRSYRYSYNLMDIISNSNRKANDAED